MSREEVLHLWEKVALYKSRQLLGEDRQHCVWESTATVIKQEQQRMAYYYGERDHLGD